MSAIGQPISRFEGRLKVTGGARYSADIPFEGLAHAAIIHSTIANGRTVSIDTTAAQRAPGVLAVFTYQNMPRMNPTPKPGTITIRTGNPICRCRTTRFITPASRSRWSSPTRSTRPRTPGRSFASSMRRGNRLCSGRSRQRTPWSRRNFSGLSIRR